MRALVKDLSPSQILIERLPSLAGALLLAEQAYKFHSFTLECLAFLATWYVFDWGLETLRGE